MAIELPDSELEAVASGLQFSDILDRIAAHTRQHRTTLIFVNTRKMAERVAHQLAERLGGADGQVTTWMPHCWWRRITAAFRRRAGASSRRDCGPEICARWWRRPRWNWASTSGRWSWCARSVRRARIGTFLQRVGRANHQRDGIPAGRLYPMTRDELVECTALLAAVRDGRLDLLEPPIAPLDVLTQQIVAEVAAAEECGVEELWRMIRQAAPVRRHARGGLRRGGSPGQLGHRDRTGTARRPPAS